jgi:hypothetical protein
MRRTPLEHDRGALPVTHILPKKRVFYVKTKRYFWREFYSTIPNKLWIIIVFLKHKSRLSRCKTHVTSRANQV